MARSSSSEPWADGFLPKSLRPGQLIGDSGIMIRGTFVITLTCSGRWFHFFGPFGLDELTITIVLE